MRLEDLGDALEREAEKIIPEVVVKQQRKFMLLASAELTDRITVTGRVDTGRLRGSFIPSSGSPSSEVPPEGANIPPRPVTVGELASIQFGDDSFLTSNLDYAPYLEIGWPGQAPDLTVSASLTAALARLQRSS